MIKRKLLLLFSMPVVGIATLIFASAIALATFLEHMYETNAARAFVYNALWFELLLSYIALALIVNVFTKRMIKRGKIGILLFHCSIFFILLGAGISRYVGKQGIMHIREGESSNTVISSDIYFEVQLFANGVLKDEVMMKVFPSLLSQRFFSETVSSDGDEFKLAVADYQIPQEHGAVALLQISYLGNTEDVWVRKGAGTDYKAAEATIGDYHLRVTFGSKPFIIPFRVQLDTFEIARYPGSISPSSFKSFVTVLDDEPYATEIYMNHVLDHRGFRFFQSSYDEDEKGTVLSVNADKAGTNTTYFGYFLLMLGMLLALFDGKSRFKGLLNSSKRSIKIGGVLFLMFAGSLSAKAQTPVEVSTDLAKSFGEVCLQTSDGRMKPINSFASEILRKVHKSTKYKKYIPEQVVLGIMRNPAKWQKEPLITSGNKDVQNYLDVQSKYVSFSQCFDMKNGDYLLATILSKINKIPPEQRSTSDKSFLALDERVNIFNMVKNGRLINMVPDVRNVQAKWLNLSEATLYYQSRSDSVSIAFNYFVEGLIVGDVDQFESSLDVINAWQKSFSASIMPSELRLRSELLYNRINIFERLSVLYGIISFIFLFVTIWLLAKNNKIARYIQNVMLWLLIAGFLVHTVGLVLRGIIAGYVPLSNGYEAMVFVSWVCLLAGFIFLKQSRLVLALFGLLAASALLVAHLSFMNPQITTLVPVLKSYWLTIHVAVITASYGFLGGSFVLGVITLLMWVVLNKKNRFILGPVIRKLITINRIIMMPGLYLISIGCFLGGIWANQSWGNYWSWDPKETWCLVSILVYTFVVHLHHFPGMRGKFIFVIGSIFSYASIIMTFFGVNYFLGGMHSYAGEGAVSIPVAVYFIVPVLFLLIWKANKNNKKYLSLMYC